MTSGLRNVLAEKLAALAFETLWQGFPAALGMDDLVEFLKDGAPGSVWTE